MQKKLSSGFYYFCRSRKNPSLGKIRNCCVPKKCPMLGARPKKPVPNLVQITAAQTANESLP